MASSLPRFELDHVVAKKHGGSTDEGNLALSCILCNKHRGSDLASIDPQSGELVRLFDPRQHVWGQHFELTPGGHLQGRTAIGRTTVRLLRLDDPARVAERRLLIRAGLLAV